MRTTLFYVLTLLVFTFSCNNDDIESNNESNNTDNNDNSDNNDESALVPFEFYELIYGVTSEITSDENWVYINTNAMPDHVSPYYLGTQWENSLYQPYDGSNPFVSNFHLNPNRISELDMSFKIPRHPEQSTDCLLYTSPSPRDATLSRMPSSA